MLQNTIMTAASTHFPLLLLYATLLCSTGSVLAAEPIRSEVVALDRTVGFEMIQRPMRLASIWRREVMRQALLIAARSEMNFPVADAVVGESIPKDDPHALELNCSSEHRNQLRLLQGDRGNRKVIWTHNLDDEIEWPGQRNWIERMESLSRDGFLEALEKAGYEPRDRMKSTNAAAPLEPDLIEKIERQLTFESQFLAIRRLHTAIVEDGETRARLGGLVQAYANLGVLTEHQWHPMTYAFKARSLIYAQRWTALDPKSALAVQHRAYAFALVGMHAEALKDLQTAEQLAAASPVKANPPAWVPLIDAFSRYDSTKITELRKDEALKPLAALLSFLCFEHEGSKNPAIAAGMDSLSDLPGCNRILDTLCQFTGPGLGQITTQMGPLHLGATLLSNLAKAEELPGSVKMALKESNEANADEEATLLEIKQRAKVMSALRETGEAGKGPTATTVDNNGLGWPALAQLIEETSFLHAYRQAAFIRRGLGVPADEVLDIYHPLVANHRLAPFLTEFRSEPELEPFAAALRGFDFEDLHFAQAELWRHWENTNNFDKYALMHLEPLPNEWAFRARVFDTYSNPPPLSSDGNRALVTPHSTYAQAMSISVSVNPKRIKPETEAAADRSPFLAKTLGKYWLDRKDLEKAERFLALAVKLDPSAANYRSLAGLYKLQGNDQQWLETLDLFLKTPSIGLEHARVQCEIVAYYAERRQWDKALPYADEAAQSGARWALTWARNVNEFNQNFETAEQLYVLGVKRYREHPIDWYLFCQRNGCGQLDLAKHAAFPDGVENLVETYKEVNYISSALQLEGQPVAAIEINEKLVKYVPNTWFPLRIAILADEVGDEKKRDAYLELATQKRGENSKENDEAYREDLAELAKIFLKDIAAGNKGELDFHELHRIRARFSERKQCTFNYFLAAYLDKRGHRDQAIGYWKLCMGYPDPAPSVRTLAGFALHNRGVEPREWKQLLFEVPDAQQKSADKATEPTP
jgi:tetratricopeptide (TPR) repeat protein